MRHRLTALLGALVLGLGAPAVPQTAPAPVPPRHVLPWPQLGSGDTPAMVSASLALGPELNRGGSAKELLADRRALDAALEALEPQRSGTVDAYVLTVALDSDPVFGREAREAGRVLARRYGAAGRMVTLASADGRGTVLPRGTPTSLTLALAHIAELMDPAEDVLVLYTTSHGTPEGLAYHYGDSGYGLVSPLRLRSVLAELGIQRRILMLSACYSGVFVPYVAGPDTAVVTAASAERTSFGCRAENDWTFFGDALVNNALRKPQELAAAADEARSAIAGWEASFALEPSQPQVVIGDGVARWLPALEADLPHDPGAPVGVPAISGLSGR
jgi:hypothetical protein